MEKIVEISNGNYKHEIEVVNDSIIVSNLDELKILYATQVSSKPPTFIIFVNSKDLFHFSYERYLANQIRSNFELEGTPIRIIAREKDEKNNL